MDEDTDHDAAAAAQQTPSHHAGAVVTFDVNGDLYLHVGADVEEKTRTYLVCSKALARASPVFARMLYGRFAESRPQHAHSPSAESEHGWTVDLPEDRQEPLELLLHIVHGAFANVPEALELTRLWAFLVVANKYDATAAARPWAKGWIEAVKAGAGSQNPLLLGVAYELGDAQVFNNTAMKVATECHLDDDGDLVYGFAAPGDEDRDVGYTYKLRNMDCLVPDGLIDDAAGIRRTLLTAMLEPYVTLYTALSTGGERCMSSPGDPSGGRRCDSMLLGSLIRSFAAQRLDLTAADPAAAFRGSASHLQSAVLKLELYTIHSGYAHPASSSFSFGGGGGGGIGVGGGHSRFGFSMSACEHLLQSGLREGVERSLMMRGNMSFAQPRHKEYLASQAAKTGLAKS
ncbi:nuclear pore protein-like protein [Colletotrichum sojae]|uniref:Nuclear pore protein-like protein n=1 Tax=Colletotrichum sojae TaxID=2175907 RepID=A0A8H6J154_9PEZI|nr:nuclear pore protein-like protein [Colletotrichum sojae]